MRDEMKEKAEKIFIGSLKWAKQKLADIKAGKPTKNFHAKRVEELEGLIKSLEDYFSTHPRCQQCGVNAAEEEHSCPFSEEIHGNSEPCCDCCAECCHQCAMDI